MRLQLASTANAVLMANNGHTRNDTVPTADKEQKSDERDTYEGDSHSESSIESPSITSPVKNSAMDNPNGIIDPPGTTNKRPSSAESSVDDNTPLKKRDKNDQSRDAVSGLGIELCDLLEEKIIADISQSFAQLKNDLQAKQNSINQLKTMLHAKDDEKKRLEEQFAVEREKLKSEISALQQKSRMKTCFQCGTHMDQPNFCSSNCLK